MRTGVVAVPVRDEVMLHVLILDCGVTPGRARRARALLEARGCETLLVRRAADSLLHELGHWTARWQDCDLAVLFDVPGGLRRALDRSGTRPIVRIEGGGNAAHR